MFATHYHELMQLPERLAHARNLNVAVRETGDRVVFLHRLEPGGTDRSYGIHVAQLAGLPDAVVRRAREVLAQLEGEHRVVPGAPEPAPDPGQLALFAEAVTASRRWKHCGTSISTTSRPSRRSTASRNCSGRLAIAEDVRGSRVLMRFTPS